jgi:hypothetical protein
MTRVQLSDEARARIGELWGQGAPPWMIRQEAGVNRHAVLREIKRLQRPPPREPVRSALRLSLAEREEISRGVFAGESLRDSAPARAGTVDGVQRGGRPWWSAPVSGM